jgi:uncharacterized membrane protein
VSYAFASDKKEEIEAMLILNVTTIVCIGLMIGVEFAVSAFINPVLSKLDNGARMHATRLFAAKLGFVMPLWYGVGLLLLLIETFAFRHQSQVLLLAVASGIWALVIILTLLFLVPINNRLARSQTSTMNDQTQREHRKWDAMHRVRVLALTTAMILLLVSAGS